MMYMLLFVPPSFSLPGIVRFKPPDRAERNPEFIQTQQEKVAHLEARVA